MNMSMRAHVYGYACVMCESQAIGECTGEYERACVRVCGMWVNVGIL